MKKIIIILISVLFGVAVVAIGCVILIDWYSDGQWSINLSDWLSAICAILSLIGTVSLAVVAVLQTEKANKQNEALAKQNDELQKINDKQFKIANQRFYPLLKVEEVKLASYKTTENVDLSHWQDGAGNYLNPDYPGSFFSIDARVDRNVAPTIKSTVKFNIKNISEAIIKNVEIYQIAINSPINNIADVGWDLYVFTFTKNKNHSMELSFYHSDSVFVTRQDALNFSLFLKITTVSDVTFYEKIYIFATPGYGYGEIEMIGEEKVTI